LRAVCGGRFSEDVDFTIFAEDLGFPGEMELAASNLSGKKKKQLAEEIKSKTSDYISQQLKEDIDKIVVDLFAGCSVVVDSIALDPDCKTIEISRSELDCFVSIDIVLQEFSI
jgi:hypothetical protein